MGRTGRLGFEAFCRELKMSKAYEVITERILAIIDKGVCPWRMPWSQISQEPQRNGVSERAYRGCNQFLTSVIAYSCGYASPVWLSYKQAQELGGQVRKGEKGCPIVYAGEFLPEAEDGEKAGRKVFFLRYSTVFNAAQIDGLPDEYYTPASAPELSEFSRIDECESIVAGYAAPVGPDVIETVSNQAFYSPALDRVTMPKMGQFEKPEGYYSVLFHELGHSTGHASRLARKGIVEHDGFGSEQYGQEELVAEMTAAFLCQRAGIDSATIENSASYLDGWRKTIKADVKLIVVAAAQAQKAADLILGTVPAEKETVEA